MELDKSVTDTRAARVIRSAQFGKPRATASTNEPPAEVCRTCGFKASSRRDGRSIDFLCGHIVFAHRPAGVELPGYLPEAS